MSAIRTETLAEGVRLYLGDCRDGMKTLASDSVDACVTDPPYHLTTGKKGGTGEASVNLNSPYGRARISTGFMSKEWDGGDIAFQPDLWREVYRVLKPGAHLVAFGAQRGYHRMACAIEDAGFEIRDSLMWIFGTGFPKSLNLDGEWAGWGTALKPAFEPIVLARKPLSEGTVAANVLRWRTGALNIDATRIPTDDKLGGGAEKSVAVDGKNAGWARPWMRDADAVADHAERVRANVVKAQELGRWPANVVHDGSDEVVGAFPDSKGQQGDLVGHSRDRKSKAIYGDLPKARYAIARNDNGSAARFFYSAKASKADRAGSKHPTIKPVSLKQWLARMVTPAGGLILDPFAGSGTTGQAALMEGFRAILCERETEYQDDIRRRISEFIARSEQAEAEEARQPDMFIEKPKPLKQEAFEL